MTLSINFKKLTILTLVFVIFTIIGTLTHEYGHIAVARYFGYHTTLHYASMNYKAGELENKLSKIYEVHQFEIENEIEFETETEYEEGLQQLKSRSLLIKIGGPLQTILTGLIGLFILIIRRKPIQSWGLSLLDWLAVFLSLFWLREVFNLLISIVSEIISPDGKWFGGDEFYISLGLDLWPGTIPLISGIIGLIITFYIIFYFLPKTIRLTFIVSGFIGGICGYLLWMYGLGPFVLP